MLTLPNNKRYIGYTSAVDPNKIFQDDGAYFESNKSGIYQDIQKYGWNNIQRKIIQSGLSRQEALSVKKENVIKHKSYQSEHGYNRPIDAGIKKEKQEYQKVENPYRYTVFVCMVPNKKLYVGKIISSKKEQIYKNPIIHKDSIYRDNKALMRDVNIFGWMFVSQVIMCDTLTKVQANYLEQYLIHRYNTANYEDGYNYGQDHWKQYSLQYTVAKYIIENFLDGDYTVFGETIHWLTMESYPKLKRDYKHMIKNRNYIKNRLRTKNFINNYQKSRYICRIISNIERY